MEHEPSLSRFARFTSYPLVMALIVVPVLTGPLHGLAQVLLVCSALIVIAFLERRFPLHPVWNDERGDGVTDIAHATVNFGLLASAGAVLGTAQAISELPGVWPSWLGHAGNVIAIGLIVDLSLYVMHRLSHQLPALWRWHAIHHSSQRLYWLNAERRHPVHALLMVAPALCLLAALGAPATAVTAWFAIVAVHLAFQHANLDYSVGPLSGWLAVAQVHRWHHHREVTIAHANYGEVLLLWDRLFGTFARPAGSPASSTVGLEGHCIPGDWWGQMTWPVRNPRSRRGSTEVRAASGRGASHG